MTSTPSLNSAAVLILQQANAPSVSSDTGKPGDDLIATANGVAPQGGAGASRASMQARAKVTEALFSANSVDVNAMKINLMRRVGEEFGISLDDHATQFTFGAAIKEAIAKTRLLENGEQILSAIEKNLGLDKLGISLDELANAITDPEGADSRKLDAALAKQAGEGDKKDTGDGEARALRTLLQPDETGLYGGI